MAAADATAGRLLEVETAGGQEALLDRMFELVLSVRPTGEERDELATFVRETVERLAAEGNTDANRRAWSMACHALFASSRFQILE